MVLPSNELPATPHMRHISPTPVTLQNDHAPPLLLALVIIATALPFWVSSLPVATDLPQHLSQIFLLEEVIDGKRPELTVAPWYFPNTLIYALIYFFWKFSDPVTAGRLTLSALAASWVFSSYLVARTYRRPLLNWLIGIPFIFNFNFTWGLLNFIVGWPIFCIFISLMAAPLRRRTLAALIPCAMLLYYAHALWFLMANAAVIARYVDQPRQGWHRALLSLLPAWACALYWYPQLASLRTASGIDTGFEWRTMPHERLNLDYIANSALGALHGSIEGNFVTLLGVWILLALISRWKNLSSEINKPLLLAALALILAWWILPWRYMNTIYFNQRWLPSGLILLLLALPAPRIPNAAMLSLGVGSILLFSFASAKAAKDWGEEKLAGFMEAIAKIERGDRVLGLNMMEGDLQIKGKPGLQLAAYAQAIKGADTNFSFTEHHSGIVQFRITPPKNGAGALVSEPLRVKPADAAGFNKVLVSGIAFNHTLVQRRLNLHPISGNGKDWGLYEIPYSPDDGSIFSRHKTSASE